MKTLFIYLITATVLLISSCTPPKPSGEQSTTCRPYSISIEPNNGTLTIGWKVDCSQLISGYNIYITPTSVDNFADTAALPAKSHNDAVYPGDTNPDDNIVYYEASGLKNGVLYQVAVRVVFPDRTLSQPSEPILAMCGPSGEFELMARYSGIRDGFSFDLVEHVRTDDLKNDLYFYSKSGTHYLASPSRLDGFLRTNYLMHQPKKFGFDENILRGKLPKEKPTADRVKVRKGDLVWMMTTEGNHVQLKILGINGANDKRTIRLGYAYWPIFDVPIP